MLQSQVLSSLQIKGRERKSQRKRGSAENEEEKQSKNEKYRNLFADTEVIKHMEQKYLRANTEYAFKHTHKHPHTHEEM